VIADIEGALRRAGLTGDQLSRAVEEYRTIMKLPAERVARKDAAKVGGQARQSANAVASPGKRTITLWRSRIASTRW
jgi:hypothetical protein